MMKIVLALALFGTASASCPNACSGHGTCGADDACTCFQDWVMGDQDGGDCSDRKCPYEFSWITAPDASGYVHTYTECSSRGICDRGTGECECFDGFTGKGCAYTTCPNDCSGHGTCEFINELTVGSVPGDHQIANPGPGREGFATESVALAFVDKLWDSMKSRACVCDPVYTDVDCSRKMCPKGNDVIDTRMNTEDQMLYQIQNISFAFHDSEELESDDRTFSLTFKSTLNESFTTKPIAFQQGSAGDFYGRDVEGKATADAIAVALLELPNGVIDGVSVNATYSSDNIKDGQTVTTVKPTYGNMGSTSLNDFYVSFTGTSVAGPQNLLIVNTDVCADGCTPQLTGLDLRSYDGMLSSVSEYQKADYNNYECGRRGKCDYDSGLCACFEGYTGYKCQTQTALI